MSFNPIIELFKEGRLQDYFNEEHSMLEHYEYEQLLL